ncbi:MAG: hypothetical protein KAU95_00425 [Candidatus Aenigmarchaeota archaeon]|nr:hypothetical protein [Candidatus Aenigmarchaeota archaeon]
MVTDRVELWDKYHKRETRQKESDLSKDGWMTDSGLSYTEDALYVCDGIKMKEGNLKNMEDYYKKLLSTADYLSEEAEKKGGTGDAVKEIIKKYVANENIEYVSGAYNLLDTIDTNKGNCLSKSTLFAGLAEMMDYDLFSGLRAVSIPGHIFVRIKGNPDKDVETIVKYKHMEYISAGRGNEEPIGRCISDILYSFYYDSKTKEDGERKGGEKILNKILKRWPTHINALTERAKGFLKNNQLYEAEQDINTALSVDPNSLNAQSIKVSLENKKINNSAIK